MFAGLIVSSMPLAIVGNNFAEAWEARTVALIGERLKQARRLVQPPLESLPGPHALRSTHHPLPPLPPSHPPPLSLPHHAPALPTAPLQVMTHRPITPQPYPPHRYR